MINRNRFFGNLRNIPWYNSHGTTCPPYGLVKITDWEKVAGGYVGLIGTRPAENDIDGFYVLNGSTEVASGTMGTCYHQDVSIAVIPGAELGDLITTADDWEPEIDGSGVSVLKSLGVSDSENRVAVAWLGGVNCSTLADVFSVPDALPVDVVGWVPYWTIVDGELVCQAEEVADCPAAAPIQTTFDTEDELVAEHDPTTFQTGTLFYVTDDLDPNRISDVYMVQGTANNLGDAFVRVGGLSPEEERQLAFWAVNQ